MPGQSALWLGRLALADFRNYGRGELAVDRRPVVLTGPNGAGKTNLLEAISFLVPGAACAGPLVRGRSRGRRWRGGAWGRGATACRGDDAARSAPAAIPSQSADAGGTAAVKINGAFAGGPSALAEHLR